MIFSSVKSSTPNALLATITCEPFSLKFCMISLALFRLNCFIFTNSEFTFIVLPVPNSIFPISSCLLAINPSRPPLARPITPTLATSPSNSALVACVVLCAIKITSSGLILLSFKHFVKASTTP